MFAFGSNAPKKTGGGFQMMKPVAFFVTVISLFLNIALIWRLQSIAEDDHSYVLDPENGTVWRLDTHAEFVETFASGSWLPYWIQAPIRIETNDTLDLIGHITAVSKKCDWRRIEPYRKLQRTCFQNYDTGDAGFATIIFKGLKETPQKFAGHPVVDIVAARIAESGKEDESPKLLIPIVMVHVGPVAHREALPEPKSAVLFRGWAARNFEIATGMVPPKPNDFYER